MNRPWSARRRQLVGMVGAGGMLAAGCSAMPSAAPGSTGAGKLDLTDVGTRIRSFVKASARIDPGRTIWATRAEVYAVFPSGEVQPVVRVKGCEQQWIRPLSETEFISFDNLVSYYCDFESDKVIREFHNPFTGARNTVRPFVSRMKEGREISPRGVVYRVLREAYPEFYAELEFDVQVRRVENSLAFQGEFRWPPEFIRPPAGSKLTTFARYDEVADPARSTVPANFAGYVLMPFFPWMEMADRPGHLLWHVQGYKIDELEQLEQDYLAAAEADLGSRFHESPEFDAEPSAFARRLHAMGRLH